MFILAKMIKAAYRNHGFVGAIVYGKQGYGKSSYALKTAFQVYGDWGQVFDSLVSKLEDLLDILKQSISKGDRRILIIWDDAGVHGNKYKWFEYNGQETAKQLQALMDVIRTGLAALIFTTPQPNELLKVFRGYDFYYIKITKQDKKNTRLATIYQQNVMPNGSILVKKIGFDRFNVMLPDDVYQKYSEIRRSYFIEVINSFL